jgi:hypothetical protein
VALTMMVTLMTYANICCKVFVFNISYKEIKKSLEFENPKFTLLMAFRPEEFKVSIIPRIVDVKSK